MRTLVIGGTGNVGRHVVDQLASSGAEVRAMLRDPQRASVPATVERVYGDLTLPETLDACLEGVDRVFLLWTAPPATIEAVVERIVRRVRRIVYLSAPYKTPHPFFQRAQPNLGSRMNAQIEGIIEASGIEWTFLRPGMFAGNCVLWWSPQLGSGDSVRWPLLASSSAPIDERDIAAVAVRALCEDGHAGAEYLMTGPQALTLREQIEILGRALGRTLRPEEMSLDEARRELVSFMSLPLVNMLIKAWEGGVEEPALVTSTVAEVTHRPARTFEEWARDHVAEFA